MFCFCFVPRDRTIKVFESMTFDEFYDKFSGTLISPTITKKRFMYANRYRRLFWNNVVHSGHRVYIPKF
jgi:hypothetical protein